MGAAKLDVERIVTEAMTLMEAEGVEAVSLRRVAARLDVKAPSLYRHIADKGRLEALMSTRIFLSCVERIPACESWQQWLVAFGQVLWDEQHRTPGALQLIAATRSRRRIGSQALPEVLEPLVALGMAEDAAATAQAAVQALVTGWTMVFVAATDLETDRFRVSLEALIAGWEARLA